MKEAELDLLANDARRAVESLVDTPIVESARIRSGVMTFKFDLRAQDGQSYIARFYPPGRAHVVDYEPELIRLCRSSGMKVPEVLATSRDGPAAKLPYMIYRKLPGAAIGDRCDSLSDESLRAINRFLVDQLEILGGIRVAGFGDLESARHARFASWREFVGECFRLGIDSALSGGLVPLRMAERFEELSRQVHRFERGGPSVLCWGDISPENIIVDPSGCAVGLVDFEGVVAADASLNLGYLRARYESTRFYASFADNWAGAHKADVSARAAFYVVLRALRLLSHGREPMPTGASRDRIERFLPGLGGALEEALAWTRREIL